MSQHNKDGNLDNFNRTMLALIPKVKDLKVVQDFRLISLCSVVYKIVAKTTMNRLKSCLSCIIVVDQSAFVPGCQNLNNVVIAYENTHMLKSTKVEEKIWMTLKLDMSKAYDRVEWLFLEIMLRKMGFEEKLISLIMKCVMIVTFSVLVNGKVFGSFTPHRGLK